jgi:hypothetical protein
VDFGEGGHDFGIGSRIKESSSSPPGLERSNSSGEEEEKKKQLAEIRSRKSLFVQTKQNAADHIPIDQCHHPLPMKTSGIDANSAKESNRNDVEEIRKKGVPPGCICRLLSCSSDSKEG